MILSGALLRRVLAAIIAVALSCGVSRAFEGGSHVTALRADRLEAKLALISPEAGGHDIGAAAKAGTSKLGPAAAAVAGGDVIFGSWAHEVPVYPERAVMPLHPGWIATVELRL